MNVRVARTGVADVAGHGAGIDEVIIGADDIQATVARLGKEISADYAHVHPVVIGVLKGAFMLMADLARHLSIPAEFDFMAVASYGAATKTSGVVRILKDLDLDIENRHVVLVEDIIDSGLTLNYLLKNLRTRRPASLEVCTLLQKQGAQRVPLSIKYTGLEIPDTFVVGYGLDLGQRYRNLPYIATLKPASPP
jgi:hypoxanthine phosphoribosyltransferase